MGTIEPNRFTPYLAALLAFTLLACGSDTGAADATSPDNSDAADNSSEPVRESSFYRLTIVFPSGLQQVYERNLDDRPDVIAFGSTHIGTAVSLAINDVLYDPFASIVFNFGFVVGSNDYPLTIDGPGTFAFGDASENAPPAFEIETADSGVQREFASWPAGAEGSYVIEQWGTNPGDVVRGTIEGTLVATSANEAGEAPTVFVTGSYQFALPDKRR